MDLKMVTRLAMICTGLQAFVFVGIFLIPSWRYYSNSIFSLVNLAFYASLALFFFVLYSKQQKG